MLQPKFNRSWYLNLLIVMISFQYTYAQNQAEEFYNLLKEVRTYANNSELDKMVNAQQKLFELSQLMSKYDSTFLATAYGNEGRNNLILSEYKKSENAYQSSIDIYSRHSSKIDSTASFYHYSSYNNLSVVQYELSKFQAALNSSSKAIELALRYSGEISEDHASSLENKAGTYYKKGDFEKALNYFNKCADIRKQLYGEDHNLYLQTLVNTSLVHIDLQDYALGENLLTTAREKISLDEMRDQWLLSIICNNLGSVYFSTERFTEAQDMFQKCLDIQEDLFGKGNSSSINSIQNIGNVLSQKGEYLKGLEYFKKAKPLVEEYHGIKSMENALALHNIGVALSQIGDKKNAKLHFNNSIKIYDELLGLENFKSLKVNRNMVFQYIEEDSLEIAQQILERVHSRYKILYGSNSLDALETGLELSNLKFKDNQKEKAKGLITENLENIYPYFNENVKYQSEEELKDGDEVLDYAFKCSFITALKAHDEEINRALLKLEYFKNGYILERVVGLKKYIASNQKEKDNLEEWMATNRRIINAISTTKAERQNLDSLKNASRKLEKKLTQFVIPQSSENIKNSIEAFRKNLNPNQWICRIVAYQETIDFKDKSTAYGAILFDKQNTHLIHLCKEEEINALLNISEEQTQKSFINNLYKSGTPINDKFLELIWTPIKQKVNDIETLYISPNGPFQKLNLNALIGDKVELHQFNNIRKLITEPTKKDKNATSLLFYDLEYGKPKIRNWQNLIWSNSEGESIEKIYASNNLAQKSLSKKEGTETNFKALCHNEISPYTIHLATHGFFYGSPSKNSYSKIRGDTYQFHNESLFRSGLVLSNANQMTDHSTAELDDGILTAFEISNLNLQNTKLVTLSACETALGEIDNNDGVYGLQRSLNIAGVENIIMSLWQVSDFHTKEFMELFYSFWIGDKLELSLAFNQARKQIKNKYKDPYYYAAFILQENHYQKPIKSKTNSFLLIGLLLGVLMLILKSKLKPNAN